MQFTPYNVDIVMCIDATASMKGALDMTKAHALSFAEKLEEKMQAENRAYGDLRVKVIVFRDFGIDADAMIETDFFTLSGEVNDSEAFHEFVNEIQPSGGGDLPENALEAIALAMKSDWNPNGGKYRRQIILVYTDNEALPLGERATAPTYPTDMPADLATLSDWWSNGGQEFGGNLEPALSRLVVFAPDMWPWNEAGMEIWDRVNLTKVNPKDGLSDVNFDDVLVKLVKSITLRVTG